MGVLAALLAPAARAQPPEARYPAMAAIGQYLMDRDAEIALARSAAPPSISRDATVLVLGRGGYETAVKGTNGFVCMVERGWVGALDAPEIWNPKIRGADCLNPPAARSVLPLAELRTELVLAGRSRAEILARLKSAFDRGEAPALEPGAMSFMMGKGSYLTDTGAHNAAHVMFFMPFAEPAPWGSDLPGSPIASGPYWSGYAKPDELAASGLPPMRVFVIPAATWSDGSASGAHVH
jgi:hypothetical protein